MEQYTITINGKSYEVGVKKHTDGTPIVVTKPELVTENKLEAKPVSGTSVTAPMPGNLFDVIANPGDQVKEGQVIMILEAMKMENEIMAPVSGRIASIEKQKGESINSGDVLAIIE